MLRWDFAITGQGGKQGKLGFKLSSLLVCADVSRTQA